jgi:hypothetical protein
MSSVRRKIKPGLRLKTLRGSVAPTYTSLQSELVMLLHQKERLEQEERLLSARLEEVRQALALVSQQSDSIRERALAMEGVSKAKKTAGAEANQPADEATRIRDRGRGMHFKQMTLHY